MWILRIRAVRCIRECCLNVGAGDGLGAADLILGSAGGLEGMDAIGVAFREGSWHINRGPEHERRIGGTRALVEDATTLLRRLLS